MEERKSVLDANALYNGLKLPVITFITFFDWHTVGAIAIGQVKILHGTGDTHTIRIKGWKRVKCFIICRTTLAEVAMLNMNLTIQTTYYGSKSSSIHSGKMSKCWICALIKTLSEWASVMRCKCVHAAADAADAKKGAAHFLTLYT